MCLNEGCAREPKHGRRGYCGACYQRLRKSGELKPTVSSREGCCRVSGCGRPIRGRRLCNAHLLRLRRYGRLHSVTRAKGTGHIDNGYLEFHSRVGQRRQGRWVAENVMGIDLGVFDHRDPESLVVHHIDGNRLNDDPSNLQVMTAREHSRLETSKRWETLRRERRQWRTGRSTRSG